MEISGKVALITGSAKRIGREIAIELAKRGARIAVHFRSSADEARETLRLIEQAGSSGAMFQADLTDPQAIRDMFPKLDREFGRLDILVNSASIFHSGSAEETTPSEWNNELDANARAPF